MSCIPLNITAEEIQKAIEQSRSMKAASILMGVPYTSFIRYAQLHGLYKPNQGLPGVTKVEPKPKKTKVKIRGENDGGMDRWETVDEE